MKKIHIESGRRLTGVKHNNKSRLRMNDSSVPRIYLAGHLLVNVGNEFFKSGRNNNILILREQAG